MNIQITYTAATAKMIGIHPTQYEEWACNRIEALFGWVPNLVIGFYRGISSKGDIPEIELGGVSYKHYGKLCTELELILGIASATKENVLDVRLEDLEYEKNELHETKGFSILSLAE